WLNLIEDARRRGDTLAAQRANSNWGTAEDKVDRQELHVAKLRVMQADVDERQAKEQGKIFDAFLRSFVMSLGLGGQASQALLALSAEMLRELPDVSVPEEAVLRARRELRASIGRELSKGIEPRWEKPQQKALPAPSEPEPEQMTVDDFLAPGSWRQE